MGGLVLALLYAAGEGTGLLNLIPVISEEMGYPILFAIGLLTSLPCPGMCGGINLSQTGNRSPGTKRSAAVGRSPYYNGGRVVSYTVLGGTVGGRRHPFIIGILNGFMPCGPLQSMQIYALSTGSLVRGALSMFLFSAGTVPLMFAFGSLSALFSAGP